MSTGESSARDRSFGLASLLAVFVGAAVFGYGLLLVAFAVINFAFFESGGEGA